MPLIYKQGDLFSKESLGSADLLCHACNCQPGGAGVAAEMKRRFPWAYEVEGRRGIMPGEAQVCENPEGSLDILCLYTSNGWGRARNTEDRILVNTFRALAMVANDYFAKGVRIHSPKINAGLFDVPWERTAKLLDAFVEVTGVEWVVWELDDREEK